MLVLCHIVPGTDIIKFPEMVKLLARQRHGTWGMEGSDEELREAFHVFDRGDNGLLSAAELR